MEEQKMYLVAIGWMFVVVLMTAAEAMSPVGTLLGAFFTLILYGLLPLSIVLYVMGTPMRRRARNSVRAEPVEASEQPETGTSTGSVRTEIESLEPDGSSHAAGDPVAAERKEP
jgi:membrane protein implicated in regulation of membrane protease activity